MSHDGWRLWNVKAGRRGALELDAPFSSYEVEGWSTAENTATCRLHREPPDPLCGCGLYFVEDLAELLRYARALGTPPILVSSVEVIGSIEDDPNAEEFPHAQLITSHRATSLRVIRFYVGQGFPGRDFRRLLVKQFRVPVTAVPFDGTDYLSVQFAAAVLAAAGES